MKVINGRWVNNQGEALTTPEEHNQFQANNGDYYKNKL